MKAIRKHPATTGDAPARRPRDGRALLERMALQAFERKLASLPASQLIEVLVFPKSLKAFASEDLGRSPVQFYAVVRALRRYQRCRDQLAARLGVDADDVADLLDRPPAIWGTVAPMVRPCNDHVSPAGSATAPVAVRSLDEQMGLSLE